MLPVTVSSEVMLSSAETPVSSARLGGDDRRRQAEARLGAGDDLGELAGDAGRIGGDDGEGVAAVGQRDVEEGEQAVGVRLS